MTFISIFLPLVMGLYLIVKKELKNAVLLLFSLIFYGWGEPRYLAIMLLTILINYFGAILVEKYEKYKKLILILTIIGNLSFLIYFKYFNFIISNLNNIFNLKIELLDIVMPIGISFYTFQAISYVVDVYRKEVPAQYNIYKLSLYISLFPQLIAGPIVKYHDIFSQIEKRSVDFQKITYGIKRFVFGLSKKVLIANTMGLVADKIFSYPADNFTTPVLWLGAICYSLQLYFDFSGYSDMAIGLGSIFGFKFLENFNYPYISKNITEFWRRWHISLSTWFKEYIYISLGGNRNGKLKTIRNLAFVFLLTGIWHGASWNFIIWGLWHGTFIILEKIINIKELEKKITSLWQKALSHIYCIFIFVIGWVIFRLDNISYAKNYIKNMFCFNMSANNMGYPLSYFFDYYELLLLIVALICTMPIFKNIKTYTLKKESTKNKFLGFMINVYILILLILSISSIVASSYNPFIYFRF